MSKSKLIAGALAATIAMNAAPVAAQSGADEARFAQAQERFDREYQLFRQETDRYQSARGGYDRGGAYRTAPDNRYYSDERDEAGYDPGRYYRPGSQERVLAPSERVYAGQDGRYYCRRTDGTTGLIVGAGVGGILGNVIDGGRSRTVGTLLGAAAGALGGRAVEQNQQNVRCR